MCSWGRLLGPHPRSVDSTQIQESWGKGTQGLAVLKPVSNPYFETCWCAGSLPAWSFKALWTFGSFCIASQIVHSSLLCLSALENIQTVRFGVEKGWYQFKFVLLYHFMHLIPVETLSAGSWITYPRCNVSRNVDVFPVHETGKPSCSKANKSPAMFTLPLGGDHLRRCGDSKTGRLGAVKGSQTHSLVLELSRGRNGFF